ncbi:hypothetical protein Tco_1100407 [Tanacetum coccineum]
MAAQLGGGYGISGIFACLKLPGVLSVMKNDIPVVASTMTLSFSEEDFTDTYSSHKPTMVVSQDKTLPQGDDKGGFQEVRCGRGLMRQTLEEDTTSY